MGAILQDQQIDTRLAELERAAYNDIHGLSSRVQAAMQVSAYGHLKASEEQIRRQRDLIASQVHRISAMQSQRKDEKWIRPCWVCRSTGACRHREAELIAIWRQQ